MSDLNNLYSTENTEKEVGTNDFNEITEAYMNELKRYPPLSREEEYSLMRQAKLGDERAKERVINSNLRFVFDMAKKYRDCGVDIQELISEGNYGMMRAFNKFNPEKGIKFITYAVWWVRQAMLDIIKKNRLRSDKEYMYDDIRTYNERDFEGTLFDVYDDEETNTFGGADYSLSEKIDDKNIQEVRKEVVEKLMPNLDERKNYIVRKYYAIGSDDNKELTLPEIARKLNLSTERVRQLKIKAMEEMKNRCLEREKVTSLLQEIL